MPEIIKSARRSAIFLAVYYSVVSGSIIVFASPLFRVLSFEYSSLIALFGSLPVMWFGARYTQEHKQDGEFNILGAISVALLPAILLPIVISLVFVRSCDTIYGLSYYAQIVLPSTLVGSLLGAFCGSLSKTRAARNVLVLSIWLATFLISLLPGYLSERIYTYGWQYGYFPGFVWDEYIEFDYTAMVWYLLFASAALAAGKPTKKRASWWESFTASHAKLFYVAIILYIFIYSIFSEHFLTGLSHNKVENFLQKELQIGPTTVHHVGWLFPPESQAILKFEIQQYLKEIASLYPSIYPSTGIDIYVYPDGDFMENYVGTGRASIAKPWLGTLHIAKENLSSLKHELVHLLLKPYGNFPIYASWSTGLTEGAAVAAEEDHDGLHTADQLAVWALQMQYASSVSPLMKFTGFAATASATSYILTGSFSKYLLAKYGSAKYLSLYHTRDYEDIYGKTLEVLDTEWKHAMLADSRTMTPADTVMARYYFERTAIVNQACLRRIGRLMHEAQEVYAHGDYYEAFDLYKQVYAEDPTRTDALRAMVLAMIKQRNFGKAATVISDTLMTKPRAKVLLTSLKADADFMASDNKESMKSAYDDAITYAANDLRYVSGVGLRMILDDSSFTVRNYLYFRYSIDSTEPKLPNALYEHAWEEPMPDSVRVGYLLLRTLFNESNGEYSAAIHEWSTLPTFVDPNKLSVRVRKAYDIIDRKVRIWMQALNLE